MRKNIVYLMIICVTIFCSCRVDNNISEDKNYREIFAMDTYMTLTVYGENSQQALNKACDKINELDKTLSISDKNSDIYKLNNLGKSFFSKESADILKRALEISNNTKGAFNPLVYPLMNLWGFTNEKYNVPDDKKIKETILKTNLSDISFDENTLEVSLKKDDMGLDFGGIAKGYTSSQIMDIFKSYGVKSGMVSLGGNVQVLGSKSDGSLWNIAVKNPNEGNDYLGIISVKDKAVITSGGYERFFEKNGKKYHHILDPHTGYPANSNLQSVTIISSDGTLADAYSTALFVMGYDKAIDFWRENSGNFDAVLYTSSGDIYITEGIDNNFSSEHKYMVIKKDENEK